MKTFINCVLMIVGALAYKLCIPALIIMVACKIWYEPYSWNWLNTIVVPLGCGASGFLMCLIGRCGIED